MLISNRHFKSIYINVLIIYIIHLYTNINHRSRLLSACFHGFDLSNNREHARDKNQGLFNSNNNNKWICFDVRLNEFKHIRIISFVLYFIFNWFLFQIISIYKKNMYLNITIPFLFFSISNTNMVVGFFFQLRIPISIILISITIVFILMAVKKVVKG